MAYCGQCGSELPVSGKYCMKCGRPFEGAPPPRPEVSLTRRRSRGNIEACILAGLAVYGVAALLGVIVGEPIGIIVSVALCVTLGFAYQKIRAGEFQLVQYLCLGSGIVAGLLVLVDLAMGSVAAALINVVALVPLGWAWYQLNAADKEAP
jgi:hypothetical protein